MEIIRLIFYIYKIINLIIIVEFFLNNKKKLPFYFEWSKKIEIKSSQF